MMVSAGCVFLQFAGLFMWAYLGYMWVAFLTTHPERGVDTFIVNVLLFFGLIFLMKWGVDECRRKS